MLTGKLAERDGALFVVYESRNFSEPTLVRLWWRVERTTGNGYNALRPTAGDTATSHGDHAWSCYREGVGSTGSVSFPGNKQAEHIEREAVPCPKVRKGVETRWRDGFWEKHLKSQGWVRL